jgi:hypothetical protein
MSMQRTPPDCWATGGPELLFGVAIFGPIVGAACVLLWTFVISASADRLPAQRRFPKVPTPVWQAVAVGAVVLYLYFQLPNVLEPMHGARLAATVFAALVVTSGGLLAATSRHVVSFRWDDLRGVPRPILVALPVLGAFSVLMGEGAAAGMLVLGGPC